MNTNLKSFLDWMILRDEGGWRLTANADDPDGGWTYAGVTRKLLDKMGCPYANYDYKEMHTLLNVTQKDTVVTAIQDWIYRAYKEQFVRPARIAELPEPLQPAMLSAAVNIGPANAVKCLQRACNYMYPQNILQVDGQCGPKTQNACKTLQANLGVQLVNKFVDEWIRHYINLVQENAEHWRQYAFFITSNKALESTRLVSRPEILYATNLEGWFNRANKYRRVG
jgi:lysozyme family protein